MRYLALIAVLGLAGCASTTSDNNTLPAVSGLDPMTRLDGQLNWYKAIDYFETQSSMATASAYFEVTYKLDNWPESDICSDAHVDTISRAIRYYPASISAHVHQILCAVQHNDTATVNTASEQLGDIAQAVLTGGVGDTSDRPIRVRDLSEAYTLLQMAGISVIDAKFVWRDGQLLHRLHTYDDVSGQFRYRYVSNIRALKHYLSYLNRKPMSEQEVSQFVADSMLQGEVAYPKVSEAEGLLAKGNHKAAEQRLLALTSPTSYARVLLALSYEQSAQDTLLDGVLDDMLSLSQRGYLPALTFMAQMIFTRDTSQQGADDAFALLSGYEHASQQQAYVSFLELLLLREDADSQIQRWMQLYPSSQMQTALMQVTDEAIHGDSMSVQQRATEVVNAIQLQPLDETTATFAALCDSAQTAVNNKAFSEQQLYAYWQGQAGLNATPDKVNDCELGIGRGYQYHFKDLPRAIRWYLRASEHGNGMAAYELGKLYQQGTGVKGDNQQALKWYSVAVDREVQASCHAVSDLLTNAQLTSSDQIKAQQTLTQCTQQENTSL